MRIWRSFDLLPAEAQGTVVALGNFDGLHLGHRAVLEAAKALANKLNAPLAVMTFEPHPRRLFNPTLPILRIVPLAERLRLLREAGVEHVFLQRFTKDFAATTATDFIEKLLQQKLHIRGVVTGDDFCFGHQRGGNRAMLQAYADSNAFCYSAVTALKSEGEICSSTRIRTLLAAGKMEDVATLLTRPYTLTGKVKRGDQRGREWGFPTANIGMRKIFYPAYGIYTVQLSVVSHPSSEEKANGSSTEQVRGGEAVGVTGGAVAPSETKYNAVANFGIRPMYPLDAPLLEVHVLDASPDLYDKTVKVELLHYLRPEAKFEDEASLRAQIAQDCDNARNLFLHDVNTHKARNQNT